MRVLKAAAHEIDSEIGTADITGTVLPYSNPPDIAREVNIERAVEHWQQMQSPFGIIGLGDMGATYTARDSWDRHAHKLSPLKGSGDRLDGHPGCHHGRACQPDRQRDRKPGTADPLIELQVESRLVFNPSPPVVDIYPADPFRTPWRSARATTSCS